MHLYVIFNNKQIFIKDQALFLSFKFENEFVQI